MNKVLDTREYLRRAAASLTRDGIYEYDIDDKPEEIRRAPEKRKKDGRFEKRRSLRSKRDEQVRALFAVLDLVKRPVQAKPGLSIKEKKETIEKSYGRVAHQVCATFDTGNMTIAAVARQYDLSYSATRRILLDPKWHDPKCEVDFLSIMQDESHFHERLAERYNGLKMSMDECRQLRESARKGEMEVVARDKRDEWGTTYAFNHPAYTFGPIFVVVGDTSNRLRTALPPTAYFSHNGAWFQRPRNNFHPL